MSAPDLLSQPRKLTYHISLFFIVTIIIFIFSIHAVRAMKAVDLGVYVYRLHVEEALRRTKLNVLGKSYFS